MLILACVAGGSGCARETFCAEAANSFAAKPAREFSRAANSTRLLPILLTTPAAFCTRVRDQSSRGHLLPPATQAMLISKENIFKRTACLRWNPQICYFTLFKRQALIHSSSLRLSEALKLIIRWCLDSLLSFKAT